MAVALTLLASGLAGVLAGLSAAAAGLTLTGRPLLDLEPARIQLFLVIGPALGLVPMAILAMAAARFADVARHAPAAFGLWLLALAGATVWFGLRPLLL